ncbi:MAG: putative O-methyltransferase YrrM [Psychromonas sp.]|jgi:predicted O-methyltransferase YrrM
MNLLIEYIDYKFNQRNKDKIIPKSALNSWFWFEKGSPMRLYYQSVVEQLRRDTTILSIEDFGAGSKKLGNNRKIKDIFNTSVSKGRKARKLYGIIKYLQPQKSLEFGTSLGLSSLILAENSETITTVEGCQATYNFASKIINSAPNKRNIVAFNQQFSGYLNSLKPKESKFHFFYLDGHHDGVATLNYIEKISPYLVDGAVILIDDIRWSEDMLVTWKKLQKLPDFSFQDLFQFGLLLKGGIQKI